MKVVAQIFGVIALIVWIISIQNNDKEKVLKLQFVATFFYSIGYLMLGAYTAASLTAVSAVRSLVFSRENKFTKSLWSIIVFAVLIIVISVVTFDDVLSFIPAVITMSHCIAAWSPNLKDMRVMFIVCALGWLGYNFIVGAYAVAIGNIFEVIGGIVAMLRFDKRKKNA